LVEKEVGSSVYKNSLELKISDLNKKKIKLQKLANNYEKLDSLFYLEKILKTCDFEFI
jgi:hypothetical protein